MEEAAGRLAVAAPAQLVSLRAVRMDDAVWRAIDALLAPQGCILWFRSGSEAIEIPATFTVESTLPTGDTGDEIAFLSRFKRC
jgi:hypothetical protein